MGILNRLHKAVNGIGGAVNAVVGIPLDIVRAPFREDEYDGIIGTLYGTIVNRGGQFFEESIGPEGAIGTLIGGAPQSIRKPAAAVLNPLLDAAEFAYREGISEPITTLTTVGSIGAAENSQLAFLDPKTWSRAYRIAQSRSPGQALALGIGKVDITDEAELASYIGSDAYKHWSGTFDGLTRFFADPTVIAGKGAAALRTKAVVQPLNSAQDIERALRSDRVARFNSEISRIKAEKGASAAAAIRDRFFPDHDAGSQISTILASAKSPDEQWLGLRALLGDKAAVTQLTDIRSKLAPEIASLNKRAEELAPTRAASYNYRGTTRDPETSLSLFDDERLRIQQQLDSYYASDLRYARLESAFAAITETPRARLIPNIPAIGEVRTSITRSDFYQSSSLARPLHAIFDMTPQRLVNLSDQSGDIQIDRLLNRAQVDLPIRDDIRSRYMAATDPSLRNQIAYEAEQTAITSIAKRSGMSTDELESVMNTIAEQRGQALNLISKRVYDEKGRSVLHFEDDAGSWVNRHLPAWVTQDQTLFPLVDIDKVSHAATRIGQFKSRHPTTQIPTELLEGFHRLWRPSVLLRVGWPIRVVGDEQLRILAKIGSLSQLNNLQSGLRNYTTDYIASVKSTGLSATRGSSNKEIRAQFGIRPLEVNGYQMEGAFGASPDMVRHTKELVSASDTFRAVTGNSESLMLRQLREAGEKFKSILPDNADYAPAYDWAVQRLSSNPIAKRVLAGEDTDAIVSWLHSTPEGTDLLRSNSVRSHNARNWVNEVKEQVDHYTAGNQELAGLIASGKATHADLSRLIPDPTAQPIAHGEVLMQTFGEGYISKTISNITESLFEKLGRTPTNVLSRNRFFDHAYRAEAARLTNLLDDGNLTQAQLRRIEDRARSYALGETRSLLYDLAEQSELGRMLRFVSPFYNAWQEVLTRWTGLAIENPAFIARARLIWQSPEDAGIVTQIDGEEYLTVPLPEWAQSIPGLRTKNEVIFNKKSFNMVLQGPPGAGPAVQIPVNEIVKHRPDLESSVKFILPFGATDDTIGMILPATAKRAFSLAGGEEDRAFRNAMMRIYFDKITDIQLGKRDFDITSYEARQALYEEAKSEAQSFFRVRMFASFTLPAAPTFRSPYQPQIDAFRQAQQRYAEDKNSLADENGNPRTPDEWFLDTHGKEYFALTQAVTKSMDGIPPTLESYEDRKKYADMVEKYPELGGLIVGYDGAGEFNSAVYQAQLSTALRPGSDTTQRRSLSFEEAAADPDRRMGWIEYRRAMDLIEAARIQRGLPSLQVKAAGDLAAVKRTITDHLKSKYPTWADDFNQTDKGKWDKKITALREIASDSRLSQRPDIQGISTYLQARDILATQLAKRGEMKNGARTLTASSNTDLAEAWQAVTGYLIESNLPFSDVFYRHLENDPVGL